MNTFFKLFLLPCYLLAHVATGNTYANTNAGFSMPDSLEEFSIPYTTIDNLIVLSVSINDEPDVNLILDTGCRNILLFGKRFKRSFEFIPGQVVKFSGMGEGKSIEGALSIENQVSMGAIHGHNVPVVVVAGHSMFNRQIQIDGLIGYDLFTRFEVELNPTQRVITFRSSFNNYIPEGYTKIPITVVDSKPVIASTIEMDGETIQSDLLVDTGSVLGLLLKSSNKAKYGLTKHNKLLGRGLNGFLKGVHTTSKKLHLHTFEMNNVDTGIIHSPWHNYASIGMDILKDYSIILNYARAYVCLKKV